jgi:Ser-tRNA(Ala) deacylase AlaX
MGDSGTSKGNSRDRHLASIPLYAEDSYLREFDAEVVKAGPRFVVLDHTAFYPESGGQPSDTGIIRAEGLEVRVRKVMRRGRDIFHYLDGNLPRGARIHGVVDWEPRFYNMRRHSAEHLLTGLFDRSGAGPKVYSDLERLEFRPSSLDEGTVAKIRVRFDEIVDEDVPVKIYYADRNDIVVGDDERKLSFLEKIPRNVDRLRMVEISDYALTFCFGTHVRSTGEIGHLSNLILHEEKRNRKVVTFMLK